MIGGDAIGEAVVFILLERVGIEGHVKVTALLILYLYLYILFTTAIALFALDIGHLIYIF